MIKGGGAEEGPWREKGQEERRWRGMNVGRLQQLPVSNQSGGEHGEDKVGGRQRKVSFILGTYP